MDAASLLTLADLNIAESNREHARILAPTRIEENATQLFVASGTRFPAGPFNSTIALGPEPAATETFLRAACTYYSALQRGFTVYTRAHLDAQLTDACDRAGYTRLGSAPGMALLAPVTERMLAAGVELRVLHSAADAEGFVTVAADAYETLGMPAAVTRKVLGVAERYLLPHWHVKVLYEHERPVACAMLLFSHGIAGVYWVGTARDARGRGHADALLRALSNHAFAAGARAVVLQATPFGEPVYKRIGYREITRYPAHLVLAEQAAAG